jgi:hypothetical protein
MFLKQLIATNVHLECSWKFQDSADNISPLDSILDQLNPFLAIKSYLFKINFNIIPSSTIKPPPTA